MKVRSAQAEGKKVVKKATDRVSVVTEAEHKNFDISINLLGETSRLVEDLDKLYVGIGKLAKRPSAPTTEDLQMAFEAGIRIAAVCQRQLTMSAITLFRGHRGDAQVHTRRAIDGVAAAWRLNRHPELARIWFDVGVSDDSKATKNYRDYLKHFKTEQLYPKLCHPDYNLRLSRLYRVFDMSSKIVHTGLFGVAPYLNRSAGGSVVWTPGDISTGEQMLPALFMILSVHIDILAILVDSLPIDSGRKEWEKKAQDTSERIERHRILWVSRFPKPQTPPAKATP